ncbi:MAG: bifunctional 2-polyprenyl-6-hydroxyphenol methylase/3-demethylubiquinol 3-O-methyltransferase UbiG [Bdellovibrionales bacterium]
MTDTVDQKEIQHFSKDSAHWWDEDGPFAPLHRLNPVRLSYIKAQICDHVGRDVNDLNALDGLRILDIGCGGGLVCESLARMGATVTGGDADAQAIAVAKAHAEESGLDIDYLAEAAENIKAQFDVVLALEIIEHVTDPAAFVQSVATLVKPGGLVIFSTLNRNPKSFLLGIVAAEYLLRWVPRGTHSYQKFIKPSELIRFASTAKLKAHDITGLVFDPIRNRFDLSKRDLDVNYLMSFKT